MRHINKHTGETISGEVYDLLSEQAKSMFLPINNGNVTINNQTVEASKGMTIGDGIGLAVAAPFIALAWLLD